MSELSTKEESCNQKQVQVKNYLSFEDICKNWTLYLSRIGGFGHLSEGHPLFSLNAIGIQLSLSDPDRCFVGEAHGFKDNGNHKLSEYKAYDGCIDCCIFSQSFYSIRNFSAEFRDREFEHHKNKFVKHFNEVHVR